MAFFNERSFKMNDYIIIINKSSTWSFFSICQRFFSLCMLAQMSPVAIYTNLHRTRIMWYIIIDNSNYYRRASVNGHTHATLSNLRCLMQKLQQQNREKKNQLAEAEKFKNRSSTITRII